MSDWISTGVTTRGTIGLTDCRKPPNMKTRRLRECCAIGVAQDWGRTMGYEVDMASIRNEPLNDLGLGTRTSTTFRARKW